MGPKEDNASTTRLNTNLDTKESSPRDILSKTKVSKAKKKAKKPISYTERLSKDGSHKENKKRTSSTNKQEKNVNK